MHLTHLSLTNFRNYARFDEGVPTGAILLVGDNAQGKTSLLEAINFLATFTSFSAGSDRQLINFIAGQDDLAVCRIVADYQRGQENHRLEVRIIKETNGTGGNIRYRKQIVLDGNTRKIGEVIDHFNAVLFIPQMMQIIDGSPSERRRYINVALAQTSSNYANILAKYRKALSQRNALLKLLAERGGDPDQLEIWDETISRSGAALIHFRIQAIQELEKLAAKIHLELTRGEEIMRLDYKPSFDPISTPQGQFSLAIESPVDRSALTKEKIETGFVDNLIKLRKDEIIRGQTTIGPHRDDLRFSSNGINLGLYGSRGQIRTALLALKIAEVAWMKAKTGQWPVLLLDEVLAELSPPQFVRTSTQWKIQSGRLILS
jgi:DNA replication and repair protein RecF